MEDFRVYTDEANKFKITIPQGEFYNPWFWPCIVVELNFKQNQLYSTENQHTIQYT